MSEQDKRPLYMGTFERYRKEMQVKNEDILTQLAGLKLWVKYSVILAGVALGAALVALAI
jgi:hypothetical protein